MSNAYAACKYIRHYHAKNGYAPRRGDVPDCTDADIDKLVENDIIEILPLYEGGPKLGIVLTDKGRRMANEQSRARRPRGRLAP